MKRQLDGFRPSVASTIFAVLAIAANTCPAALAAGPRRLAVRPMRTLAAPENDFTIGVPSGWGFSPGMAENPIKLAPSGQTEPEVYIIAPLLLNIDRLASDADQRYRQCLGMAAAGCNITNCVLAATRDTTQAEMHKWTARQAVEIIENWLARQGWGVAGGRIFPLGDSKIVVRGQIAHGSVALNQFTRIALLYVPDLSGGYSAGRPMWVTYGFLYGCETKARLDSDLASAQTLSDFSTSTSLIQTAPTSSNSVSSQTTTATSAAPAHFTRRDRACSEPRPTSITATYYSVMSLN